MNFLYRIIPFAFGWIFGRGMVDLTSTPRNYYNGIVSITLGIFCFVGWMWNTYRSH